MKFRAQAKVEGAERSIAPDGRSRRSLLRCGMGALAALAATPAAAPAQIKISQAAVGYQDQPKTGQRCAACAHFTPPGSCQLVSGAIDPQGWCRLFTPASARTPAAAAPIPGSRS